MTQKIEFPYEVSEKTKAAFRQENQMKKAIELMTEAIAKVASENISGWETLKREHPELVNKQHIQRLRYDALTGTIDIIPD